MKQGAGGTGEAEKTKEKEGQREGKGKKEKHRENIQRSHESRDNSLSSIEIYRPNREIFNASVSASCEQSFPG